MEAALWFGRDALVIGYTFVLRIGVPILITLMIGAWLKHSLEEHREESAAPSVFRQAAPHCWDITKTADTVQAKAVAAQRPDLPCWLALQVSGARLKEMCYHCPIFTVRRHAVARA